MKKLKLILGLALAALVTGQAAQAVPSNNGIVGDIGINATDFSLDGTNFGNSTMFTSITSSVTGGTGDYAGASGDVTTTLFTFGAGGAGSAIGPVAKLWSLDLSPTTTFDLLTATIMYRSDSLLVLEGSGLAKMAGKEATYGVWNFSANASIGGVFNFSSTTSVPDSGTTVSLLGLSLFGLAAAARRFKK